MNLHAQYKTQEEYYNQIDSIVGTVIKYCDMQCKVISIHKYVRPEDFEILEAKCFDILKIINPTEKDLESFEDGYLFASSKDIMHSYNNY